MTTQDLHAIYEAAYAASSPFEIGGVASRRPPFTTRLRRLLHVERAVEELARHDATDGRPMRSRAAFEKALQQGSDVLSSLGLALELGT